MKDREGAYSFAIFVFVSRSIYYLNDIPSSRRPWLHRSRDYNNIDKLLQKYSELTRYSERRHPEQFASAFSQNMRGLWAVPRRNPCFIGRESPLDQLKTMLSKQDLKQSKSIVRVCGFGGVGKSTMVTEYCYRYERGLDALTCRT